MALPVAMATGNLTLLTDSLVHRVLFDEQKGRASGVRVIDKNTGESTEHFARVVFLCASTMGTAQIMLNSRSRSFPNGIANSSDMVGRNLMDHHADLTVQGLSPGFRISGERLPLQLAKEPIDAR